MTYAVTFQPEFSAPGSRLARTASWLETKRADRRDRAQARRIELAMSEEARIHAQARYRRVR